MVGRERIITYQCTSHSFNQKNSKILCSQYVIVSSLFDTKINFKSHALVWHKLFEMSRLQTYMEAKVFFMWDGQLKLRL